MDVGNLVETILYLLPLVLFLYNNRKDSRTSTRKSVTEVKDLETRVSLLEMSIKHSDERDKEVMQKVTDTNRTVDSIDKGFLEFQVQHMKGMEKIEGRLQVIIERQGNLEKRQDKFDERLQAMESKIDKDCDKKGI